MICNDSIGYSSKKQQLQLSIFRRLHYEMLVAHLQYEKISVGDLPAELLDDIMQQS